MNLIYYFNKYFFYIQHISIINKIFTTIILITEIKINQNFLVIIYLFNI